MNAVEIEAAVSALAERPFEAAEFPFAFLEAFGNKATTIKKLRSGVSNRLSYDFAIRSGQDGMPGPAVARPAIRIKPGTRLVRDWGGDSHHVLVLDDGFLYRDERYRSLTTIAHTITGARWSGPRFFGLRKGKEMADA